MEKIDYIVPTWNSGRTLEITISSIEKYGNPRQIIIVDRFSTDDTIEIARRHACQIVQTNRSLGAARLEGSKDAKTELIAFVDSDVELNEDWRSLLSFASDEDDKYKDAGVFGAYYDDLLSYNKEWPIKLDGGNGAFGCIITRRSCILSCSEMEDLSSAEDRIYAKFLSRTGLKWYIFPISVRHNQDLSKIPHYLRLRWLGAGLRVQDGFKLGNVKKILGGAVFGIKMNHLEISYIENWRMRWNYFIGYIKYKKYYEIDRDSFSSSSM